MDRSQFVFALVIVCIVNGIFSPFVTIIATFWPVWFPTLVVPLTPTMLFYFSSLILATATLLAAGVPAAIYERVAGLEESTTGSIAIWLLCAVLLSLPSVPRIFDMM